MEGSNRFAFAMRVGFIDGTFIAGLSSSRELTADSTIQLLGCTETLVRFLKDSLCMFEIERAFL
jgi:hypothetical protein